MQKALWRPVLRVPVATVVGMVAEGMTDSEILTAYPDLEDEDIREALRFAAESLRERELPHFRLREISLGHRPVTPAGRGIAAGRA